MIAYHTKKERMKGKPTTTTKRLQMLHDLPKGVGCAAVKRAAEERKGWTYSAMMSEAALQ